MSGTPKYTTAQLVAAERARIEAEAQRRAREAEKRRRQAAAREEKRRLEAARKAAQEAWNRAQSEAQEALARAEARVAALRDDETLRVWEVPAIEAMASDVEQMRHAMQREAFADVVVAESHFQAREDEMTERAAAQQAKLDARDAIAEAMRGALHELGFVVSDPTLEHPTFPTSAVVFSARSAANQVIGVSVPTEGQVWYQVEGYAFESAAQPQGGAASTCDQAEDILKEMHQILAAQHQVETSGLHWEGKPHDRLRDSKQLPKRTQAARGQGR